MATKTARFWRKVVKGLQLLYHEILSNQLTCLEFSGFAGATKYKIQDDDPRLQGPCVRKENHELVIPALRDKKIEFTIHEFNGVPFICYLNKDSDVVQELIADTYGKNPGPHNFSFGDQEKMSVFSSKLSALGIEHTRGVYFGNDTIGWSGSNDEQVKEVLRKDFDVDLDERLKNAVYKD